MLGCATVCVALTESLETKEVQDDIVVFSLPCIEQGIESVIVIGLDICAFLE